MNLVTDPWIPILHQSGERRLVSLHQVFTEGGNYTDLAVRPHERIALMRLLIAIAQAALDGPDDIEDWDTAAERLSEVASDYLTRWIESFELFHTRHPFLQVTKLSKPAGTKGEGDKQALTSVSKMDFALATGNNTTLFDHGANSSAPRSLPQQALPVMLITFLCFSPGGLIAQVYWDSRQTSKSSKHAPCTPSSMLHTFVRRPILFETVHANLLTRADIGEHLGQEGWGKPIWEWMPSGWQDEAALRNATRTYLGRLVPLSRFIHLQTDETFMLLGDGLDYPTFPDFPAEPSATVVLTQKGTDRALLGAGEKAIWRELSALIIRRWQGQIGGAITLRNVPDDVALDIWVGAFLTNKASIEDTVESVLHVPALLRSRTGRGTYDAEVKYAENIEHRLGWAVETWRDNADGGWEGRLKGAGPKKNELRKMLRSAAVRHFWTAVERLRPLLLAHIETLGSSAEAVLATKAQWRKAVRSAAFDAYRLTCGQDTPRQIRAYALGLIRLTGEPRASELETEQVKTGA